MRILRFSYQSREHWGIFRDGEVLKISGDIYGSFRPEYAIKLDQVQLLAPAEPRQIICIGLNYQDHIQEMGDPPPKEPMIFAKAVSALNGPESPILLPAISHQVELEGELAIVMGKKAKGISESEAMDYVFGYTCANDVTARDLQKKDGQFFRAKSFDSFGCLGPWIETELDPTDLKLETRLNGKTVQSTRTSQLLFGIQRLVSHITQVMTLYPGDVISSGTPSGVSKLHVGDEVEVEIEGIGILRNPVQAAEVS